MKSGASGESQTSPRLPLSVGNLSQQVAKARHDLRNPLSHILGFSEMLLEEAKLRGHENLKADVQLIYKTAERMIALTNHYLEWPKVEAGLSDITALEDQLQKLSEAILSATGRLIDKARALNNHTIDNDLARISGAACQMLEMIAPVLRSLTLPFSPERSEAASALPRIPETSLSSGHPLVPRQGNILVVDDLDENRALLSDLLSRLGYSVQLMDSGQNALNHAARHPVDLILLDLMMPEWDGVETLKRLKAHPPTQHIPVIMLCFSEETDTVMHCLELGAEDFLTRPFHSTLLIARLESTLAKRRLRDQEQAFLNRLQEEQNISQRLLLNILPQPIAERLRHGEKIIADSFSEATVLFTDFVGFTQLAAGVPPAELLGDLSDIFSAFDRLCDRHGLEKIKTIGDAYMVAGGLPLPREDHAEAVADIALEMQQQAPQFTVGRGQPFRMRIGIHTGPVMAGVIGTKKFAYDLWGETVNLAKHMESHAPTGSILTTAATYERLKDKYALEKGQNISLKSNLNVETYLLLGKRPGRAR